MPGPAQPVTRESFFPLEKPFPENYVSIIKESGWAYKGSWSDDKKRLMLADTTAPKISFGDRLVRRTRRTGKKIAYSADTSSLYETVKVRYKVRGKKIVINTDIDPQRIIYIDSTTMVLQSLHKKSAVRRLYRRAD